MSDTQHTLAGLLEAFPDLMPILLEDMWVCPKVLLRVLRLVSKDLRAIAEQAITSSSITFCMSICPIPDLMRMGALVKHAKLKTLRIKITQDARFPSPVTQPAQALACIDQLKLLLGDMFNALKTVTRLEIYADPSPSDDSSSNEHSSDADSDVASESAVTSESGVAGHQDVVFRVGEELCRTLATALPLLQDLSLGGEYNDVELAAFGAGCPLLTSLTIEGMRSLEYALRDLPQALPNLNHLTLHGHYWECASDDRSYSERIGEAVHEVCELASGCSKLKSLQLDFKPEDGRDASSVWMECVTEIWENLPESLTNFSSNVFLIAVWEAYDFMERLRVLSLDHLELQCLGDLMNQAPGLQRVVVTGSSRPYVQLVGSSMVETTFDLIDNMERCYEEQLQLSCQRVGISGCSDNVSELMGRMYPLVDTTHCNMYVYETKQQDCELGQISRLCPSLVDLHLRYFSMKPLEDVPLMDETYLSLVEGCVLLEKLEVQVHLRYTHAGLMRLCKSLPSLTELLCLPCEGVCFSEVTAELAALGRDIIITEVEVNTCPW